MTTLADIDRERAASRLSANARVTPPRGLDTALVGDDQPRVDARQDAALARLARATRWGVAVAAVAALVASAALVVALRRPSPPPTLTRLECPTLPACPAAPTCPTCPPCPAWPTPRERPRR